MLLSSIKGQVLLQEGQIILAPAQIGGGQAVCTNCYLDLASGSALRFNKLGLDHLSLGEEPAPQQQVEEALSFIPLCSAPLDQETLLSVDLGTAHSAAVTGEYHPGTET